MPALLPLDCLLGGINFMHTLLIQTIGPLVVVGVLELAAKVLHKKAAMEAAKVAKSSTDDADAPPPTSAFLAELCSNVSFFVLFLLYPGSSAKIFNALLCNTFDGEGESGESFLRVVSRLHLRLAISLPSPRPLPLTHPLLACPQDFSIDCKSDVYQGFIFPYAIGMIFVYPLGVPLYYAFILFRNKEELSTIRQIELSITNEVCAFSFTSP